MSPGVQGATAAVALVTLLVSGCATPGPTGTHSGTGAPAEAVVAVAPVVPPRAPADPAQPLVPQRFLLHFEPNSDVLTAESRTLLSTLAGCNPVGAAAASGAKPVDKAGATQDAVRSLPEQFDLYLDPVTGELTPESRALLAVLSGCVRGVGSYVVLLPSPDGSVGRITVENRRGEQVLLTANTGVNLDGRNPVFEVGQAQLERDFKSAMEARPPLPEHFILYFEVGGIELTAASKAVLPQIMDRARARAAVDISVVGHSDALGSDAFNELLARRRADAMAAEFRKLALQNLVVTAESQGERMPLVPTPDGVAEARNRRVEITVR